MKIKIFATGGTFEKEYDEINGILRFGKTHCSEILEMGRSHLETEVEQLMMIDSLYMTNEERKFIAEKCMKDEAQHIVITHGTDTMSDTAQYLIGYCQKNNCSEKTIVLTGAMIPYKFGTSDGLFNFGNALAFVQVLPPGVYVVMHGKCFPGDKVRKNREKGEFETIVAS